MDNIPMNEQPASLENAEPLELARELVKILDMKKARDIRLLRVDEQTILADYFIICGGTSSTAIKALAGEAEFKMTGRGAGPLRIDGYTEGQWIVIDFGSVIVHIMSRDNRDFYKLEKLWSEAESIDISDLLTP